MRGYAPEYTKRERIIYGLKLLAWMIPIALFLKLWFFGWLSEFSRNANCYNYGSINGVHLVLYGLFVFMPLSFALVMFLIEGRRSIKIIKLRQNPLPNEKVLKPTRYKYGFTAKIQPFIMLLLVLCLVGISVWGSFQAYEISKNI
jgi:hypothetical protein